MKHEQRLFFCYRCGGKLLETSGENPRLKCQDCNTISYENPIVGVAGIVVNEQGQILLVQRADNVDYGGLWCIPCGYVEYDEDVRAALRREMKEETNLDVMVGKIFAAHSNFHNPKQHTVGIWFECLITGGDLLAGDDAQAVGWFALEDVPELAFPTDRLVLEEMRKNS